MKREFYREYQKVEDRHWWFLGRRRILLRLLDDHLKGSSGRARLLLDVGCGTGTMLSHLKRFGWTYGVDMDREAVGYCRERGLDTVLQASAAKLPFADATFDLVTMLDVLEHIADEDGTLAEVRRVVRPGGLLIVAVPAFRFLWGVQDEVSQHQRRYTARQLKERIEAAGLKVRKLSYFNTVLFPPIAAVRLARRAIPQVRSQESDFNIPAPGPMNAILASIFGLESALVPRADLPFGVSLVCLAETPVH